MEVRVQKAFYFYFDMKELSVLNSHTSTSELESYHSLIYNRSLLRKSANNHYESEMIQAAGGAASLYWNLGFYAVEKTLSKVAHWSVNTASREKLKSEYFSNKSKPR